MIKWKEVCQGETDDCFMEKKTDGDKLTIDSSIFIWATNLSNQRKRKVSEEMEGKNVGKMTDKCFI